MTSANYSAEWSGRLLQPAADIKGWHTFLFIWRAQNSYYSLQRAPKPDL